jgi:ankyrin repeat protein
MVSRFFGGLIVLVIANAAVFGVMQLYLRSPDTIRRRQQDAFQAVQGDNAARLKTLLHRGLDPNRPDDNGQTLLMRANELGREDLAKILREAGAKE